MPPFRRAVRGSLSTVQPAIYVFYLVVAVVLTYPALNTFSTQFIGHPFSDAYELARHIWWIAHAIRTGQPILDQPLLAYPDGLNGVLLWSYPLQSFPAALFALVMPLPAAYNLALLLRLALNGWSVFWLTRYLLSRGDAKRQRDVTAPALLAGLVFTYYPTFQGHIASGHPGLLALWPVALALYALVRLYETGSRRWLFAAALCVTLSAWGSTQLLIFTIVPLTGLLLAAFALRRQWRPLLQTAGAVALGLVGVLPFAVPLLLDTSTVAIPVEYGVVDYSADLLAFAAPSFYHPLFRGNALSVAVIGVDPFEGTAYVGIVVGVLALLGGVVRPPAAPAASAARPLHPLYAPRWWLVAMLVFWVLSLGALLKLFYQPVTAVIDGYATHIPLPWAALYDLPFIRITRTPARFNFMVGLAVAALAGFGMAWLWQRARRRRWLRAWLPVVFLWIMFEYHFWWGMPTTDGIVPAPIAALADHDEVRAVLDIPVAHPLAAKEGLFLQTGHARPLIAGYMTRITPVSPARLRVLEATLDPALLNLVGADVVILHRYLDTDALEAHTYAALGEPFYEDERYAAFYVPQGEQPAAFAVAPPGDTLTDATHADVYLPGAARLVLRARLRADAAERTVSLLLDGVVLAAWQIGTDETVEYSLDLAGGFHRLTFSVDPPCPRGYDEATLACRAVALDDFTLELVP